MVSSDSVPPSHRLDHLGDLGAVIGGDHQIVSRLQGHHRHGAVGGVGGHRLHGQVIGHHHAVKAQVVSEQIVDRRGQGGGERCRPPPS